MMRVATIIPLALLCGCAARSEAPVSPARHVDYPEWVVTGSGYAHGLPGRLIVGVGSVTGLKNQSLSRTTADNRARAEVAKTFEVYGTGLVKDYLASTIAGDMSATSEEQHVTYTPTSLSATILTGVEIVNHWVAPDGTWFAHARIGIAGIKDIIERRKEMSRDKKDYVIQNAARAFDAEAGPPPDPPPCRVELETVTPEGDTGQALTVWYVCSGGAAEARIQDRAYFGRFAEGGVTVAMSWTVSDDHCVREITSELTGNLASDTLILTTQETPQSNPADCAPESTTTEKVRAATGDQDVVLD